MNDEELIERIIPLWYAVRAWGKTLLVHSFELDEARDILKTEFRGTRQIPSTNWFIRTHGIGVDIYKTPEVGGIDFDFGKPDPDEWRLRIFFEKQYNDNQLPLAEYHHLADDEDILKSIIKNVITKNET